jgi:glycerophosphoryl diester phosphodiesterase
VIENMPSGFRGRHRGQFRIETDLQISADGEAMVHHDFALGRLTDRLAPARRDDRGRAQSVRSRHADRMMTLGELCELVAGRVPLVIELKSRFDGDRGW